MVQLFKGIASKADTLINELQSSLHSQEEKLIAYAQQQREVYQVVFSLFQVLQPRWQIVKFFNIISRLTVGLSQPQGQSPKQPRVFLRL